MSIFNDRSRTQNVIKSSVITLLTSCINTIIPFIYRFIFVQILSAEYLGINGLFSNILQLLSLMDLGISTAIVFRFYEPISNEDVEKVGQLISFFKTVYSVVATMITVVGLGLLPFIYYLINDTSEIPADINLRLVYILFLLQTVVSYTYSYKQSLLQADQNHYVVSIFQCCLNIIRYILQIIFLIATKKYIVTLVISIFVTILMNYVFGLWITRKYGAVFQVRSRLSKEERKGILDDTKACMFHKIGGSVLYATDNIVLTKCVSLAATGLFSNYTLIVYGINNLINQVLGTFTTSIGNANVKISRKEQYKIFKKMLFINFLVSGWVSVGMYCLLQQFVLIWLGQKMLMNKSIVLLLCIQFYLESIRQITIAYTMASGLFVKDKFRPLIESFINVIISVIFAIKIGVAGVILGTIISHLLTVNWRDPYILYRHHFNRKTTEYWRFFIGYTMSVVVIGTVSKVIIDQINSRNVNCGIWIMEGILLTFIYFIIEYVIWNRSEELKYFVCIIKEKIIS